MSTMTVEEDDWRKRWEELEARDEPLLPELMDHVCPGPWGPMVEHRLIREFFLQPGKCGLVNYRFLAKQKAAEEFLREKKWMNYLLVIEKPYRIYALLDCREEGMHGAEWWKAVAWAWGNSENMHQNRRRWRDIWAVNEPERAAVMEEEEHAALAALPDPITIWRGTRHIKSVGAMSWTVDRSRATWFARRFWSEQSRTKPLLVRGRVAKADVLAYFSGRNESEIVSTRVKVEEVITLSASNGSSAS
jgi:hypothetical protein